MDTYMVEVPHTSQECMQVMDKSAENKNITKFEWGCMSGAHTGFAKVKAKSEEDAKKVVAELVRKKSRAVKLSKISEKDVRKWHEM